MLRAFDFDPELGGQVAQSSLDLPQRRAAIERGFARAEQVQVWSVEDGDPHFFLSPSSQAVNCSMSCASADSPPRSDSGAVAAASTLEVCESEKNWSNEKPPSAGGAASGAPRNTWSSDSSLLAARVGRPCGSA